MRDVPLWPRWPHSAKTRKRRSRQTAVPTHLFSLYLFGAVFLSHSNMVSPYRDHACYSDEKVFLPFQFFIFIGTAAALPTSSQSINLASGALASCPLTASVGLSRFRCSLPGQPADDLMRVAGQHAPAHARVGISVRIVRTKYTRTEQCDRKAQVDSRHKQSVVVHTCGKVSWILYCTIQGQGFERSFPDPPINGEPLPPPSSSPYTVYIVVQKR